MCPRAIVAARSGRSKTGMRGTPFQAMLGLTVLCFGGYALLLPVVPRWAATGGSGAFGAGATTGALMLTTVLTQLVVPSLLRRLGYRWVLGIGLVLLGAPAPVLALSAALGPVLGLAAVRGVGFGLVTVAGSALVAELVPAAELGRASALYGLAIGLPQLALLPAGVGVAQRFGFVPVLIAGASPLLALALLAPIRVGRAAPARERVGAAGELASEPVTAAPGEPTAAPPWLGRAIGPLLAMLVCATAQGGLVTFLPLAHRDAAVAVPTALFGTAAGALVGRLIAGELTDRRGWGGRLLRPGVLLALAGIVLEAGAVGAAGGWPVLAMVPVGALLVGLGFGLVQNDSMVRMFALAGPTRFGAASALWNIAYDAGTGLGAVGLGAVAEVFGYRSAFGAAAVALLITAVTPLRGRPRLR